MNTIYPNMRKDDEYETPLYAVKIIEPYLKPHSKIWCPFDKDHSNFVTYLREREHDVVNSHIEYGQDFFTMSIPENIDYIISNPPYSKKDEVYARLFEINKPWAMLVNLQSFCDSKKRAALFAKYGIEVMYVYPRIKYIKDGIQTKVNIFQSGYVCHNILPQQLQIEIIQEEL